MTSLEPAGISSHAQDRVVVIGAGPAGLMAAQVIAEAGVPVDVHDAMASAGRKFLLAGKGGLNLTHSEPRDAFFSRYGDRRDVLAPLLDAFGPDALRAWAGGLGVATFVGTSGRVFPTDLKAAPLLRAWLQRLRSAGVRFHMRHRWIGWNSAGALRFAACAGVDAGEEVSVSPRATVLALGARIETGEQPSETALCIVTPLGDDVTRRCTEESLDATRTVGLDMLFPNERRRSLMGSPLTSTAMRDAAHGLLASDGARVSLLRDSAGLVAQRVVATIVNIGCDIAQQGIAEPGDIDRAVTLGLGYPRGPLAWGDELGAATVLEILANLHALSGDPRYRASPWLRRRAELGVSLLTPDA